MNLTKKGVAVIAILCMVCSSVFAGIIIQIGKGTNVYGGRFFEASIVPSNVSLVVGQVQIFTVHYSDAVEPLNYSWTYFTPANVSVSVNGVQAWWNGSGTFDAGNSFSFSFLTACAGLRLSVHVVENDPSSPLYGGCGDASASVFDPYVAPSIYLDALPTGVVVESDGSGWFRYTINGQQTYSSTNATKVIQFAAGNTTNGGSIPLKAGTYTDLNVTIINMNITVIGEGMGITNLVPKAGCFALNFYGPTAPKVYDSRGYTDSVRDLSILGTASNSSGIYFSCINYGLVQNVEANVTGTAFANYRGNNNRWVYCVALNCTVGFYSVGGYYGVSCGNMGMDQALGLWAPDMWYNNCFVYGCDYGFYMDDSTNGWQIKGCGVEYAALAAFYICGSWSGGWASDTWAASGAGFGWYITNSLYHYIDNIQLTSVWGSDMDRSGLALVNTNASLQITRTEVLNSAFNFNDEYGVYMDGTIWVATITDCIFSGDPVVFRFPNASSGSILIDIGGNQLAGSTIAYDPAVPPLFANVHDNIGLTFSQGAAPNEDVGGFSYLIFTDGTTTFMRNGSTGRVDFSSANASKVLAFASGNCSSGDTVYVKSETYILNGSWIVNKSNITLASDGAILFVSASMNKPAIYWSESASGYSNIKISGFEIDGNKANQATVSYPTIIPDGIQLRDCNDFLIEKCYIHDCKEYGVWAGLSYSSVMVHDGTIKDCMITNAGWNAITFGSDAKESTRMHAYNVVTKNCSDVGISVYSSYSTVENCIAEDMQDYGEGAVNSGWGFACEDQFSHNNLFIACYAINCFDGFVLQGGGNSTVQASTASGSTDIGFKLYQDGQRVIDCVGVNSSVALEGNNGLIDSFTFIGTRVGDDAISLVRNNNTVVQNCIQPRTSESAFEWLAINGGGNNTIWHNTIICGDRAIDIGPDTLSGNNRIIGNVFFKQTSESIKIRLNSNSTWIDGNDFWFSADDILDQSAGGTTTYGNNHWYDGTYDTTPP